MSDIDEAHDTDILLHYLDEIFGWVAKGSGIAPWMLEKLEYRKDAIRQALERQRDGWKLVPVEPTEKMMDEYMHAFTSQDRFDGAAVYKAMIEAAPDCPTQHHDSESSP